MDAIVPLIKYDNYKKLNNSVCFFASYSYGNEIQEYVFYYLAELKKNNFDIVFISSSPLRDIDIDRLKSVSSLIIEKSNYGLDFSSWYIGLKQLKFGKKYSNVLLVNDSVFGPLYDLADTISIAEKSDVDMFGMTDSREISYHLQSYFLYFKSTIIKSSAWLKFWNDFKLIDDKQQIISDYEIGLSQFMLKNNFKLGAFSSYNELSKDLNIVVDCNQALAFYNELITRYNFPFFKRELLIKEGISNVFSHLGISIDTRLWKNSIESHTKYPVFLIENFQSYYFNFMKTTSLRNQRKKSSKVLFISHNASLSGAPIGFLNFIRWFKQNTNYDFEIIIRDIGNGGDKLLGEFQSLAKTSIFCNSSLHTLDELRHRLLKENVEIIFSNTLVNFDVEQYLAILNCPQICYVHELEYVIQTWPGLANTLKWIEKRNTYIIACSEAVKSNLVSNHKFQREKIKVVEEFISPVIDDDLLSRSQAIRKKLNIPEGAFVVGGVGTIEWRKGSDLFVSLAKIVNAKNKNIYFIWLGADNINYAKTYSELMQDIEKSNLQKTVQLITPDLEPDKYYSLFDVVAMVSREDPYPLVNLHAALFGKPIICFEGSGGSMEFAAGDSGFVVPYLDLNEMANKILNLYSDKNLLSKYGNNARKKVNSNNITEVQAPKILKLIESCLDVLKEEVARPRLNVITHIYYDSTYENLQNYLVNLEGLDVNYFFSISLDCLKRKDIINKIQRDFPNSCILETPNIGKDIGGKLALLGLYNKLNIKSDYLIMIHDKMSPQTLVGDAWRNNLLKILLPHHISEILQLLANDKSIGIIGAKEHIFSEYDNNKKEFRYNNELSSEYLQRYNINIDNFDYISGTMYWMRSSILEDFFKDNVHPIHARSMLEQGNVLDNFQGTHSHTWERMFCWIARNQGYSITGI
jgi:lipopolysaccharide biosynthesis protein